MEASQNGRHGITSLNGPFTEDSEDDDITDRLATARRRIKTTTCLFCSTDSLNLDDNLTHMSRQHSFFIPDREHLIDISGLLGYLGEKIVIGNICLFCPDGGREFSSLEAVRKHMIDKGHCKIAFETNEDLAELSEYFDWGQEDEESEWEDAEDGSEAEHVAHQASSNVSLTDTTAYIVAGHTAWC
jgi:pre-60S factor REI1